VFVSVYVERERKEQSVWGGESARARRERENVRERKRERAHVRARLGACVRARERKKEREREGACENGRGREGAYGALGGEGGGEERHACARDST